MARYLAKLFNVRHLFNITLICTIILQSCTTIAISTIVASSTIFSRYDKNIINSRLVRQIQSDVNQFLRKNNHRNSIKLAQDGNSVYIIGVTESKTIKQYVLDIVAKEIGSNYIDEITVIKTRQPTLEDALAEIRLKKHLIFTKNLKSQNYQVFVFNGKGYIVGRVGSNAEKAILVKTLEGILYLNDIVIYISVI